jgi:hypothetical protein
LSDNEKLGKLLESLERSMTLGGDDLRGEINTPEGRQEIKLYRFCGKGLVSVIQENYSSTWTLKQWVEFRDRCLVTLR